MGQGRLTTHVLDTALGRPAEALAIALHALKGETRQPLATALTNGDGRTEAPLLDGDAFQPGYYELSFLAGPYLARVGLDDGFLDTVIVRFRIAEANAAYHVPLLLSPYGYSTYRGS
ncbi:MAG: hydroxyisourate hydrolase [Pseudomonadota bacterium]